MHWVSPEADLENAASVSSLASWIYKTSKNAPQGAKCAARLCWLGNRAFSPHLLNKFRCHRQGEFWLVLPGFWSAGPAGVQAELHVGDLWWLSSFGVTAQSLLVAETHNTFLSFSVSPEGEFLPRVSIPDESLDIPLLGFLQPSVSDTVTSELRGKSWYSYFSANMEEIHLEFRF